MDRKDKACGGESGLEADEGSPEKQNNSRLINIHTKIQNFEMHM